MASMLVHLRPENALVQEQVLSLLTAPADARPATADTRLGDFDNAYWRIEVMESAPTQVFVCLEVPCFAQLKACVCVRGRCARARGGYPAGPPPSPNTHPLPARALHPCDTPFAPPHAQAGRGGAPAGYLWQHADFAARRRLRVASLGRCCAERRRRRRSWRWRRRRRRWQQQQQ